MSLFQLCYGPEIHSIYYTIQSNPKIKKKDLVGKFQYKPEGDIDSLIEEVLHFLCSLEVINISANKEISTKEESLEIVDIFRKINFLSNNLNNPSDPNYVFTNMFYDLFVKPNILYIKDLHCQTNEKYEKASISKEKINAWKRIMEYFGLGYRYNGGFYALPTYLLIKSLIKTIGVWDGPLQQFIEKEINPVIPCVYKGNSYHGIVFGLLYFHKINFIQLSRKQDIPFEGFGVNNEWNWISVRGEMIDSLSK